MEQEIQYCTSADGTRIAFSIVGGGPGVPLMYVPPAPFSDITEIERNWLLNEAEVERLWRGRAVCFVNPRGSGMSDRDATDFDLERLTDDLEAVVERTGWSRFSLFGMGMSGLIAILYTSRHHEAVTRLVLRETFLRAADTALRDAIRRAGGTAIEGKLLGDGVLATFNAAREAIACAAACHSAGSDVGLDLHVGIHAGDVIREEGNVFGGAVNVAARISDASEPGETLVSGTVRDLARTSAGVSFEDRGERDLKGVSDAVRVWAVGK